MTNEPSLLDKYNRALEEISDLKELNGVLFGNIAELHRMLDCAEEIIEELRDYKWMYEELQ